jgi:hypothetical protein
MAGISGYLTVGVLMLAGWTFLDVGVVWAYLGAAVAFEFWLLRRAAAMGRHPADAGAPPYHFTEEEARIVGRFRFYFTETGAARALASVLAAIGLTAMVLAPWLAYRGAVAPAGMVLVNMLVVVVLTRRLVPMGDTGKAWDKIRAGNQAAQ